MEGLIGGPSIAGGMGVFINNGSLFSQGSAVGHTCPGAETLSVLAKRNDLVATETRLDRDETETRPEGKVKKFFLLLQ